MSINKMLKYIAGVLLFSALLNVLLIIFSLNRMTGDGRIVNFAGIVRGATQRLVKLETSGRPSDELIKKLDGIVNGLISGDESLDLVKINDDEFSDNMRNIKTEWDNLKKTITAFRSDDSMKDELILKSEKYFELTQANASGSEEVASNTEEIAAMAESLKSKVDYFKV